MGWGDTQAGIDCSKAASGEDLDSHAELNILRLVSRVRVEVIRCAPVELVALADLATHDNAQRQRGHTGRHQTHRAEQVMSAVLDRLDRFLDPVGGFAERT
jgi:hypothetical protein